MMEKKEGFVKHYSQSFKYMYDVIVNVACGENKKIVIIVRHETYLKNLIQEYISITTRLGLNPLIREKLITFDGGNTIEFIVKHPDIRKKE